MADSLILKLPGSGGTEINLTGGSWKAQEVNLGNPPHREEWVSGVDTEGALPARVFRRDNREVTFSLRVNEAAADMDDAMDLIAALNQAIEEAKRVASRGVIDPALDSVRLIWSPHASGESRTFTLPVVGGEPVEVPLTNQGEDAGWFKGVPKVRVKLVCAPFGYGPEAVLADTTTDSNLIASNAVAAVDLAAVGGDVPPWMDVRLAESDSQIRNRVLVAAESPATGDTDYIAATSLTTTGYGGSVSSGTLSMTSTEWRYMAEIPVQSHARARKLMLTHATGGGQVRVRWKQSGVERVSEAVTLPASGYGDVDVCRVEGEWLGVIEGKGTVSLRGLSLLGVDGWCEAKSSPGSGLGTQGELTHSDNTLSGTLNASSLDLGGTWSSSGATTDFSNGQRSTTSDSSARIGLAGSATPGWVQASLQLEYNPLLSGAWPIGSGLIVRYTNTSNFVFAGLTRSSGGTTSFALIRVISGTAVVLAESTDVLPFSFDVFFPEVAITDDGSWWFRGRLLQYAPELVIEATGQDAQLSSSGTLATGRVGIYDRWSGSAHTRLFSKFAVYSTPWATDPLLPAAGDLRLADATLLGASDQELPYRGMGLTNLHPQHPSRLYVMARRGRDAGASVATNETDNLDLEVRARPRYLSVPS